MSEDTPGGDGAERGPLRRTLDVCVFAPVGMAVTLAEELPEFVDKGRRRVQLKLGNAKVVGRSSSPGDSASSPSASTRCCRG